MIKEYPAKHEIFNNNIFGRYSARKFFESLNYSTKVMVPLTREIDDKQKKVIEVATDEHATRIAFDWCYEQLGLYSEEARIKYLHKLAKNIIGEPVAPPKPSSDLLKRLKLECLCTPALRMRVQGLKLKI
jgi:hypothetical protein